MDATALAEARAAHFRTPPPRKVACPIVDTHTHPRGARLPELIEAAEAYGVTRLVGIGMLDALLEARGRYPQIVPATTLDWEARTGPDQFREANLALLRRALDAGVRIVKLWFAPRILDRTGLRLDTPLLDPIFAFMQEHRMGTLIHVSDPDVWFERRYTDVARYGTKAEQYPALERRLTDYPGIPVQLAHMGGDPEHLDHLAGLLARYPNLYLDLAATKWMTRELGRRRDAARAFLVAHRDRILFGTDQVVIEEDEDDRYHVRYWIYQMFLETDLECPLPIGDPDCDDQPMLRGLDLPVDVLEDLYYRNAARALGVTG